MASQGGKWLSVSSDSEGGNLSRVSNGVSRSPIVSDASYVANRLLKSTGKAAWIAGTTFLVLIVPLIFEMDREQQLNDLDLQQASLLGLPPN